MKFTSIITGLILTAMIAFIVWVGIGLDQNLNDLSNHFAQSESEIKKCLAKEGEPVTMYFGVEYVGCRKK